MASEEGIRRRKTSRQQDKATDDEREALSAEGNKTEESTSATLPPQATASNVSSTDGNSSETKKSFVKWMFRNLMFLTVPFLCTEVAMSVATKTPSQQMMNKIRLRYQWYKDRLPEGRMQDLVHQLNVDEETNAFLHSTWPMFYSKYWLRKTLTEFMSPQDASALLGGNPMFVLSSTQIDELLGDTPGARLLDVGSGDGAVTKRYTHRFSNITCVEVSTGLRVLLHGVCHQVTNKIPIEEHQAFDVISMLNVLDRVHEPAQFLAQLKPLLKPGGKLILAQVSPYRNNVATNSGKWEKGRQPFVPLLKNAKAKAGIEKDAVVWVEQILEPSGWVVESISKVPYLCNRNNRAKSKFALLDDLVFVLSLAEQAEL